MTAVLDPIVGDARVRQQVAEHPYPLVFATVSGAHLYGFASPDSDVDLRGVHVLAPRDVLGLERPTELETLEVSHTRDGLDVDLVTHDARKFFALLLRRNGYVLEQRCSPLVVHTTPEHAELRALVPQLLTRHHAHHYLGFAANQWRLFQRERPWRVKPLLYVYRVLLTGIHLMRSGEVEANLVKLNEAFRLAQLPDLISRKRTVAEGATLLDTGMVVHEREYPRLTALLEEARDASGLPEVPTARPVLHDLLLRLRGV